MLHVIFDDAVMNQRDIAHAVRVSVNLGGRAVGCPTRMAHAHRSLEVSVAELFFQALQSAFAPEDLNLILLQNGDAGRVVAAVLEPFQSIEQNSLGIVKSDITYDSAHVFSPWPIEDDRN